MQRKDFIKTLAVFAAIPFLAYGLEDVRTLKYISGFANKPGADVYIDFNSIEIQTSNMQSHEIDYIMREYKYKQHVTVHTSYSYNNGYNRLKLEFSGATRLKSFLKELNPYITRQVVKQKISRKLN